MAETHPQHRIKTTGLDVSTGSGSKLLPSDHGNRANLHPKASHPNQNTYRNPRRVLPASKFSVYQSIISDIEAAEKLTGCIIDFQI